MKKKDGNNVINIPGKKGSKTKIKKLKRVYLELQRTDIFYLPVDVPINENFHKENESAIKLAWTIINNKLIDPETLRIGDAFSTKILKKEEVEVEINDIPPKQK